MDFVEIGSGRYHRNMKILKIITPSGSEFMAFSKNDKLMMIGGGGQTLHFL